MRDLDHSSAAGGRRSFWAETSSVFEIIFFLEALILFFPLTGKFCVSFIPLISLSC